VRAIHSSWCSRRATALSVAFAAGAGFAILLAAATADAACDLIPSASITFRGALGSINRPFSAPGEIVELRLSPVCDAASTGFATSAADHVVTLVFTPPDGPRNVIVMSPDCQGL
jgi:hypothetical protein